MELLAIFLSFLANKSLGRCICSHIVLNTDVNHSFLDLTNCPPLVCSLQTVQLTLFFLFKMDLVFTRLSVQTVSDNLGLRDDWHLRSLDTRCIRSLNGERIYTSLKRKCY